MGIKENQLPTASEVTENNLIRTVNENGASQNMTVDQLGGLVGSGGGLVLHLDPDTKRLDKTYGEINSVISNGGSVYICFYLYNDSPDLKYEPVNKFEVYSDEQYYEEVEYCIACESYLFESGTANVYPVKNED